MGLFDKFSKPKLDAYAIEFIRQLKSVGDQRNWQFDSGAKRLVEVTPEGGGSGALIELGNLHGEYAAAAPSARDALLQRHARGMQPKKIPDNFAHAEGKILPVLIVDSARGTPAILDAQRKRPDRIQWPSMPLFARVEVALAYDTADSMIHINGATLESWKKQLGEVLPVAMKNLQRATPRSMKVLEGGVYSAAFGDSYDAARLLLTDWILTHHVKGQPLAMVPNRNTLLVTGADNEVGVAAMISMAEKQLQQPRAVSPLLLRLNETVWEPYFPAAHAERLTRWHWQSRIADHADQKKQLDQWFKQRGEDIFVATFVVKQDNLSKTIASHCSGPKGYIRCCRTPTGSDCYGARVHNWC